MQGQSPVSPEDEVASEEQLVLMDAATLWADLQAQEVGSTPVQMAPKHLPMYPLLQTLMM